MNAWMQTFRALIRALQGAIVEAASKIRPEPVLLIAAYHFINRSAQRLQTLFERWQAGTLPALRASRAGIKREPRPRQHFPAQFGWLAAAGGYKACGNALELQRLINQPEFIEFATEVPRAARIIRPLRHMLGIHEVPAVIGATIYFKPPRPRRAPPPQTLAPPLPPSFTPPNFEFVTGTRLPFVMLPNHGTRKT